MGQAKSNKPQTTAKNGSVRDGDKLSAIVLAPNQDVEGVDKTGKQVHYKIGKYLGEGWTAVVYEGIDIVSKKPVALKVLRPNSDKLTIDNFRGEKKILDEL